MSVHQTILMGLYGIAVAAGLYAWHQARNHQSAYVPVKIDKKPRR